MSNFEKRKRNEERNLNVPELIDSFLVNGMFYNLFQRSVIYEDKIYQVQALLFQILLYLEFCGGEASVEEILFACWVNTPTLVTFRRTASLLSAFLNEVGVPKTAYQRKGIFYIK